MMRDCMPAAPKFIAMSPLPTSGLPEPKALRSEQHADAREDFLGRVALAVQQQGLVALVLSKPHGAEADLVNVHVRRIVLRGQDELSFVYRYKTRDVTKNFPTFSVRAIPSGHYPADRASKNTVIKLMLDAGKACQPTISRTCAMSRPSVFRWMKSGHSPMRSRRMCPAKAAPDGAGDTWTWTAIDADSKMILVLFRWWP